MKYKAFLFDLNGTMINDVPYHVRAWYRILNELGGNISTERAKEECYGKNQELLERVFPNRFSMHEKNAISIDKERQYQREFKPHLKLIDGLADFLKQSKNTGIKLAIGTAAIQSNVDFVVDGLNIRHYFDALVSADDVVHSKPDPETYLKCAAKLRVDAKDCLVFEDAPKGAESAKNAAMDCLIITTLHKRTDFDEYNNIVGFIGDFNNLNI